MRAWANRWRVRPRRRRRGVEHVSGRRRVREELGPPSFRACVGLLENGQVCGVVPASHFDPRTGGFLCTACYVVDIIRLWKCYAACTELRAIPAWAERELARIRAALGAAE